MVMLRATSEMAVAMRVRSVRENPSWAARSLPIWRAATMSVSADTVMRTSSATALAALEHPVEVRQPLLEVKGGVDLFHAHAELNHGEGHLGLDPDDDHHRPSQPGHVGDRP